MHDLFVLTIAIVLIVCAMGNSTLSPETIAGEVRTIKTHLGEMSVRIVGQLEAGKTPVICIPGMSEALVDEWVNVAILLSENGFVVAIVNFHSNPQTKPALLFGGIQPQDVSRIINEAVLQTLFHAEKAVIMGKSWGGYQAFTHVTSHPDKVIKLVLQAPGFSNHDRVAALHKTGVPTFLAWAKDDPVVWYSTTDTWAKVYGSDLTLYTALKGGHAVIKEYAEPILKFLTN